MTVHKMPRTDEPEKKYLPIISPGIFNFRVTEATVIPAKETYQAKVDITIECTPKEELPENRPINCRFVSFYPFSESEKMRQPWEHFLVVIGMHKDFEAVWDDGNMEEFIGKCGKVVLTYYKNEKSGKSWLKPYRLKFARYFDMYGRSKSELEHGLDPEKIHLVVDEVMEAYSRDHVNNPQFKTSYKEHDEVVVQNDVANRNTNPDLKQYDKPEYGPSEEVDEELPF